MHLFLSILVTNFAREIDESVREMYNFGLMLDAWTFDWYWSLILISKVLPNVK